MRIYARLVFFCLAALAFSPDAGAWGRRGHQIVADVAARLLARSEPGAAFLEARGYDLGYYANVPDLTWKRPATYKTEWTNHFMDLEIFEREFKNPAAAFALDRKAFDATYPSVEQKAGRAFWRVRELDALLETIADRLRNFAPAAPRADRQALQLEWLVVAGALGHYVGDMAQPLHCTENFDGRLSDQKGLHAFYEDDAVDALFPDIERSALAIARARWRKQKVALKRASPLDVIRALSVESKLDLPWLFKTDKRVGRLLPQAAAAYRKDIAERLAAGAVALAALWRRHLEWTYDGEKFFAFTTDPSYIEPGDPSAAGSGKR